MNLQPTATPRAGKILVLADSQGLAFTNALYPTDYCAAQLASQGLTAGYALRGINCGNSGWTTAQLSDIAAERFAYYKPNIAVIYAGVNDTGGIVLTSITRVGTTATATVISGTMPYANGATLAIANATDALYNGNFVITVTGANTFTYTMGGTPAANAVATGGTNLAVTTPFTGAVTQAYIEGMVDAAITAGASYVVVVDTNYQNYSGTTSGYDNVGAGHYNSTYQTLRTFQLAAYTARLAAHAGKVGYYGLFTAQYALIVAGTWTQGTWQGGHVADGNQHMNAEAQRRFAAGLLAQLISAGVLAAYKIQ